jgi:probable rRNA maturation factor
MGDDGSGGGRTRLVAEVTASRAHRGLASGLGRWLARAAPARARGTVAVALVTDAAIRRLNRTWRGVDRATDVLSFSTDDSYVGPSFSSASPAGLKPGATSATRPPVLGDIAIAVDTARRQAREHGHPVRDEIRILALHGLLHLLGYDHDADRGEMARVEERLRRRAGLPAGLITRTRRPTVHR